MKPHHNREWGGGCVGPRRGREGKDSIYEASQKKEKTLAPLQSTYNERTQRFHRGVVLTGPNPPVLLVFDTVLAPI